MKKRDNGYKLYWERLHLDIRKKCLPVRTIMPFMKEEPPQGCAGVSIAGGFQDVIGKGAR